MIRLNSDDYRWVVGMNRIRHAYIQMHPDRAGYFVASPYDDAAGALQPLGIERSTIASAGAAAYAIKAARAAVPAAETDSAGRLECRWQREQLPDAIRELVLDDQRLRNEICWSVLDC